jgi:hypothetical protein
MPRRLLSATPRQAVVVIVLIHLAGFLSMNVAIVFSAFCATIDVLVGIHFGSRVAEWLL